MRAPLPAGQRSGVPSSSRPVPWTTVAALAALMAFADGFVLVSIQGAVGAIERTGAPFVTWLWTSILTLPIYLLAVLAAVAFARRRLGPDLRTSGRIVGAAVLIAVAGTLVAFAAVTGSAVYDYHLQSTLLTRSSHIHTEQGPGGCTGLCSALAQTREADERGARYATSTDLAVNVVVVGWVLALRGGRLETASTERLTRQRIRRT